jgi:hypothetical protein
MTHIELYCMNNYSQIYVGNHNRYEVKSIMITYIDP